MSRREQSRATIARMRVEAIEHRYRVRIEAEDRRRLPPSLREVFLEGEWLVTIEPAETTYRDHSSFLSGYAPEDEGLYDDLAQTG